MRNGLYKLIRFDDGHEELYRLEDDPNEQNDLLLLPSLNLEAASNYTYLCGELQQLVGGSSCLSVAVNEPGVLLEKNWHIQPNPVNTILSVVNLSEGRLWSVRNLVGQELLRGISSAATFDLDVRNWPNGVYYFQAEGIGKCWVKN
ncbi:MAG: T9SS type A sorting domain-containing protein [Saprospiraceae bacterium]|nr:T9SS type A sorting domain-containing protein [Saprospiraceae bacterium]